MNFSEVLECVTTETVVEVQQQTETLHVKM